MSRLKRMWQTLFGRCSAAPPPDLLAGEVRQAQQRLSSSARVVAQRADENTKQARELSQRVRERVDERLLATASQVFDIIDGSGQRQ